MTTTTDSSTYAPVRKSVTVRTTLERAFSVFSEGIDSWWPRSHHIGKSPLVTQVLEPKQGGRCYGLSQDGTQCDWGQVVTWQPPHRLVFAWQISEHWQYEPDLSKASEVEVLFTALPDGTTRVDLEHRHFERHGAGGESMRTSVGSPNGGWGGLLTLFAGKAEPEAAAGLPAGAEVNPLTASVRMIFALNEGLIGRALDGLGDQDLWHRPTPLNNPALWIAGHAFQTRAAILKLFGESFDTGWGELFRRGAPLTEREAYPSRDEILEVGGRVSARLKALLGSLNAEQLAAPARGPKVQGAETMADILGFFALHDSYHVGQLAYVRKGLGYSALVG